MEKRRPLPDSGCEVSDADHQRDSDPSLRRFLQQAFNGVQPQATVLLGSVTFIVD